LSDSHHESLGDSSLGTGQVSFQIIRVILSVTLTQLSLSCYFNKLLLVLERRFSSFPDIFFASDVCGCAFQVDGVGPSALDIFETLSGDEINNTDTIR